jgi:hypothetical protein
MLLIVMMWSTLVMVPVVTPLAYDETLSVDVVPDFCESVPVLPSGPLHLWLELPNVDEVMLPIAVLVPLLSSVTVPAPVPTVQVKLKLAVVSVSVKVVPLDAVEVKFVPPVTVHVLAAIAAGTARPIAVAIVPATKTVLARCLRIVFLSVASAI